MMIYAQEYLQIDVLDAREGGGYYYVWVSEKMRNTENGRTEVDDCHWVYKLARYNGAWYIYDYTSDPLFAG